MLQESPDKALVVKNAGGRSIGVLITTDEYNALRATYDLVAKSPNGIKKITGEYLPDERGLSFEEAFAKE